METLAPNCLCPDGCRDSACSVAMMLGQVRAVNYTHTYSTRMTLEEDLHRKPSPLGPREVTRG
jgi:hypothetical protein